MNCDCGSLADKRDGSGWSCAPCRTAVSKAQASLAAFIVKSRVIDYESEQKAKHADSAKRWKDKNLEKVKAYQKEYERQKRAKRMAVDPEHQFNRYQKAA